MSPKIARLYGLHDKFNDELFGWKLMHIRMGLMKKNRTKDGVYEVLVHSKHGEIPIIDCLHRADIKVHSDCFACDDWLWGVLIHEMIHQYQCEVLNRTPNHDAIFCSIARKAERIYGVPVR